MFDRLDEEQNKIQQREIEDFSRENYNQPLAVIHQYNSSDDLSEFQPLTKPAKKRQQQVYNFGFVVWQYLFMFGSFFFSQKMLIRK